MSASAPTVARRLDRQSRVWLEQLHADGWVREAALARLHAIMLSEARYEVRRRTSGLTHPSGRDLDELALQAADDGLMALLGKVDQFRGDALFTTWARRFAQLAVPGEIRRRLGHARETPTETPTDCEQWPSQSVSARQPQELSHASELARTVGNLIADKLTSHQREVLIALAVDEVTAKDLAKRLDSTPGALYKTLHDARQKLKQGLADTAADEERQQRRMAIRCEAPALTG
jgi:RNA polymerase sigma-70 factor, ECF subfamily